MSVKRIAALAITFQLLLLKKCFEEGEAVEEVEGRSEEILKIFPKPGGL